jgi:hypothetical protein
VSHPLAALFAATLDMAKHPLKFTTAAPVPEFLSGQIITTSFLFVTPITERVAMALLFMPAGKPGSSVSVPN